MAYHIVRMTPEHAQRLPEFTAGLWTDNPVTNAAYYDWKYLSNPYVREPLIYLAFEGDELAGMRGFMGARWELDGQQIDIPCACDLLIGEQHRNRGIFKLIMDFAMRDLLGHGYRFVFNLSAGSPLTRLSQLAFGWKGTGSLGVMEWSSRPKLLRYLRHYAKRSSLLRASWNQVRPAAPAQPQAIGSFDPFQLIGQRAAGASGAIRLLSKVDPEGMAGCVARLPPDGRLRHVRNAEYFAWRYRNPLREYRFLANVDLGISGYLVLAARRHDPWSGLAIADWEAASPEIARDLLRTTLRWGKFRKVQIWSATLPPSRQQLLRNAGFFNVDEPVSAAQPMRTVFVGRAPGVSDWSLHHRELLDPGNWDLRMIYSDEF